MEYTKGPWEVVELKSRIPRAWDESFLIGTTEEYGKQCTAVAVTVGGIGDTEKANSNLLAAAPDLYKALKMVSENAALDFTDKQIAQIEAVLRKAEGK
jgi:hypothetical protein